MKTAFQVKPAPLDHFTVMVKQATSDLQAALRRAAGSDEGVVVWAIPTYDKINGQIIVAPSVPAEFYDRPAAFMPRVIRPADNRAHRAPSWGWVPYSDQFHVLWQALRHEPILPNVES